MDQGTAVIWHLQVDIELPKWGVYLYGRFKIDFQLPAIVVNFINDRGWGEAVKNLPYIGPVSSVK